MKTFNTILLALVSTFVMTSAYAQYPNRRLTKNTLDQSEPAMAVSPINSNSLMAVWNDFRATTYAKPGYAFSTDGGGSWTNDTVFSPMPGSFSYGLDPSCGFDRRGNAFFCYFLTNVVSSPGQVWNSRTTDRGIHWFHKSVSTSTTGADKPFMTVDNSNIQPPTGFDGRIYVTWTDFSSGSKIKFSYSSDTGNTFPTKQTLDSLTNNPGTYPYLAALDSGASPGLYSATYVQAAMPAVGPNGEVYVTWMSVDTGFNKSKMRFSKSTNGGASFSVPDTIRSFTFQRTGLGGFDIANLPTVAVGPSGDVYVAYAEQVSKTNHNYRIKFTRSTSGGTSWDAVKTIGDLNLPNALQFFPFLTVDANEQITVAFMHTPDLVLVDPYVTQSTDNGATFSTPKRISNTSSNPIYGRWTHHYMGIASASGLNEVFMPW